MDEHSNRRKALRYKADNLKVQLNEGEITADVIDVSLEGFSFTTDQSINCLARRRSPMLFLDGHQPASYPLHGQIIGELELKTTEQNAFATVLS